MGNKWVFSGLVLLAGCCFAIPDVAAVNPERNSTDTVVRSDGAFEYSRILFRFDSIGYRQIRTVNLLSEDNLKNRWDKYSPFRATLPSDWNRTFGSLMGTLTSANCLRSTNLEGILANMARTYMYQLNVRNLVQSYRDYLLYNLSEMTNELLEGSLSESGTMNPDFFGSLYRSVTELVPVNSGLGKFGLEPSLAYGSKGIRFSYRFLYGSVSSSWNIDQNKVSLKIRIPLSHSLGNSCPPEMQCDAPAPGKKKTR